MKNILVIFIVAMLAGCGTLPDAQPKTEVVTAKVAVKAVCIKEPAPVRPVYETETLPDNATDGHKVVALVRDWLRSRDYEVALEVALEGCR
jgi:hypothetical protein